MTIARILAIALLYVAALCAVGTMGEGPEDLLQTDLRTEIELPIVGGEDDDLNDNSEDGVSEFQEELVQSVGGTTEPKSTALGSAKSGGGNSRRLLSESYVAEAATGESIPLMSHDLGSLKPCRISLAFLRPSFFCSSRIRMRTAFLITSSVGSTDSSLLVLTASSSALYPGSHCSVVPFTLSVPMSCTTALSSSLGVYVMYILCT